MNFWWVSQNRTFSQESSGGFLWSPKLNKDGGRNHSYDNMTCIQPGDVIFSFAKQEIPTIGIATSRSYDTPRPHVFNNIENDWDINGWKVDVKYHFLENKIRPSNHMKTLLPLLPEKHSPIQPSGRGNQAYLFSIPQAMAQELGHLIGSEFYEIIDPSVSENAHRESIIEQNIQSSNSLDETEKVQLVKSRRGQGIFRKNVASIEQKCRLTGISLSQHLIASHIKPWKDCDNKERLDGNNGLLLAPHIDHLFDKGYISFENCGSIILSPQLHESVIETWGVRNNKSVHPFNRFQSEYLNYHRNNVFKKV